MNTVSLALIVSASRWVNEKCMLSWATAEEQQLCVSIGSKFVSNLKRDLIALNDNSLLAQRIEKQLNTQKMWFEIKAEEFNITITQ